jgi:two-component system chemotaxis response regulator CheB
MPPSRVVVIGASAGGVEAVSTVIAGFTRELRAAVLVVIHTSRGEDGLAPVLGRACQLPVRPARDGTPLADGHVYVARPDRHLAVQDGHMRVVMGPTQHGFRPAVDVLFHSAAQAAGRNAAGVILSGALSDGVSGLRAIKHAGGRAIVQNPEQAEFPSMPLAALREVEVDVVLPLTDIARDVEHWASDGRARGATTGSVPTALLELEHGRDPGSSLDTIPVTCPACGGALSETHERALPEYVCHVGHRYNGDSLLAGLDNRVEGALWTAIRALQEKALLRRRMHKGASSRTMRSLAARWLDEAREAERQAELVRGLIEASPQPGAVAVAERIRAARSSGRRAGRDRREVGRAAAVRRPATGRRRTRPGGPNARANKD